MRYSLEFLDLVVVEGDFGELSDAGVDPIHDLPGRDLLFQHGAAPFDPFHRIGSEMHLLIVTGDLQDLLDGQTGSRDGKAHDFQSFQRPRWLKQVFRA